MHKQTVVKISVVLAALLLLLSLMLDWLIGRERLAEVSTVPNYKPTISLNDEPEVEEKKVTIAPNVTLTDAQGNTITLEDLRGKPVILSFWASWVGSCARQLHMFQEAYNEYKDSVHFVMVNTTSDSRETKEKAQQMITENGYTFPIYYDMDASVANEYSVIFLPTTFFIDANGLAIAFSATEIGRANLDMGLEFCIKSAEEAAEAAKATESTETTESTESTETTEATVTD